MNTLSDLKIRLSRLVIVALTALCGVVQAAWVADFRGLQFTVYLDAQTVVRNEAAVRVPTMYDYGVIQTGADGQKYYSVRLFTEVDCKGGRVRLSAMDYHEGRMGTGAVVFSSRTEADWELLSAEDKANGLWKLACGR